MSKFYVWIDDPTTQVLTSAAYNANSQRIRGFAKGETISSQVVNTAVRQANLVAVALMEALGVSDAIDLTSSVEDVANEIREKIANQIDVEQTTGESETAVMSQKAVTDEINDIWAKINWVAPAISTLVLTPSTSSFKLPATFNLTKFTHAETNIANINGTLTFKRGSTTLKSGISPASSNTEEVVSDNVTLTESTITYTLSGVDKQGKTFSMSRSVSGYYTSYFGANTAATVSDALIGALTDTNSKSLAGTRNVTTTAGQYVWFVSTQTISKVTSGGFEVPTTLVNASYSYNGGTYKCYRTTEKVQAGDNSFVVV